MALSCWAARWVWEMWLCQKKMGSKRLLGIYSRYSEGWVTLVYRLRVFPLQPMQSVKLFQILFTEAGSRRSDIFSLHCLWRWLFLLRAIKHLSLSSLCGKPSLLSASCLSGQKPERLKYCMPEMRKIILKLTATWRKSDVYVWWEVCRLHLLIL